MQRSGDWSDASVGPQATSAPYGATWAVLAGVAVLAACSSSTRSLAAGGASTTESCCGCVGNLTACSCARDQFGLGRHRRLRRCQSSR